jgi:hypothetical protein
MPPRTYVYIDGFNLYYGAVKGTSFKWLNVSQLCELLFPDSRIDKVRYFTARVSVRKDDPDKPTRQQRRVSNTSASRCAHGRDERRAHPPEDHFTGHPGMADFCVLSPL